MQDTTDKLFAHAIFCAKANGYVNEGDTVVITAGVPLGVSGGTNTLKVEKVPRFYIELGKVFVIYYKKMFYYGGIV